MGVTVAVTRVACNTTTGTQDITTPDLGGLTPKAALFILSAATADGTARANAAWSYGAATGASNEWVTSWDSQDAQATAITSTLNVSTTACIRLLDGTGAQVTDGEADFTSFIADGVRINWSNAPSQAWLLTVVLFAGTDLSAHANVVGVGNTVDLATDVTAPGFEPHVLITAISVAAAAGAEAGMGLVHNNGAGTVTQFSFCHREQEPTTTAVGMVTENRGGILETLGVNTIDWYGEFGSFDASGFSITTRLAGGNSISIPYLALKFAAASDAKVYAFSTPTATGSATDTGAGFQPQFVMYLVSQAEAAQIGYDDSRAGVHGIAVIDADEAYCVTTARQDAAADSNTQSLNNDQAVDVPDHTGTADIVATFTAFTSTGVTLDWTNVTAVAKWWPALAIKSSGGAFTLTADSGSFAITGTAASLEVGREVAADSGAFSITGTAASLEVGREVAADPGSYAITGTAATLRATRRLTAESGTFAITGTAASLEVGREVAANPGSYVITGGDATLTHGTAGDFSIAAESGSFAITGTAASLEVGRAVAAAPGAFTITGTVATLRAGRTVAASTGAFAISGTDATLLWSGLQLSVVEIDLRASYEPTVSLRASNEPSVTLNASNVPIIALRGSVQ